MHHREHLGEVGVAHRPQHQRAAGDAQPERRPEVGRGRRSCDEPHGPGPPATGFAGYVRGMGDQEFRTEHDSMGEVQVPREALWRAQTQRAVENFPISGTPIEPALIHAIGEVKAAAAKVNGELGVLDAGAGRGHRGGGPRGRRRRARRRVPDRRLPDRLGHQLQHERQRGDRLARRPRPASRCTPTTTSTPRQSSNDTFPTAIHVAASLRGHRRPAPRARRARRPRSRPRRPSSPAW